MNNYFDNPNNLTDAELIRLVQCRDEAAFTELISRYSPRIWNIVLDNSRQVRDAEEILMDIWLVVWQNIIGLRKVGSFSAWLRKIANSACNRYYASKKSQYSEIVMSYEDLAIQIDREAEQRFHDAKLRADAREAVHQLPNKVRSIAEMYYLDLFSINDIAKEYNLPIGTVKSKLRKVRQLLRKEFGIGHTEEDTMSTKHVDSGDIKTKCKIVGIGGAGCNAVEQLSREASTDTVFDVTDIEFCAIDTDYNTLNSCSELTHIPIGANVTQGQGTRGSLELGRRAAAENMDELYSVVSDADMLFIIAGMGGGTGTAVAPIIASLARAQRILTVCITTRPLDAEEKQREENADQGLSELQDDPNSCADAIIVIPNHNILDSHQLNLQIGEFFQCSGEILVHAVGSILDILGAGGEINIHFGDLESIFRDQGVMLIGIGKAKGKNRATIAAKNAVSSLLIQENTTESDSAVLISIYSPPDFTMQELDDAMCTIVEKYQDSEPVFGVNYKDELEKNGEVIVTIISSADKRGLSTPSFPTQGKGKTLKGDHETSSATDPDSIRSSRQNIFGIMFGQEEIPDTVQTAIDNCVSAAIIRQ